MRERKLGKIEMARGFAATYVFAGHLCERPGVTLNPLLRFGQEMVMCFFLLSGFVIYYATHEGRHNRFRGYFIRRFRRIYPTFLIALLLSGLVSFWVWGLPFNGRELLGNMFMLQDFYTSKPGIWVNTFSDNLPLWSLSYEWWFYMMFFPIYVYVPVRQQLALVATISFTGLVSYVVLPNQISLFLLYFILWWTGLEFARTYCRGVTPTFHSQRHSLIVLAGFCFLVPLAMFNFMAPPARWMFGLHPFLEARHFCACLLLAIVALVWSKFRWRFFNLIFGIFTMVAPISYALYAFHFPLIQCLPSITGTYAHAVAEVGVIALAVCLAYLVEVKLQRLIVRWTNPWLGESRSRA